MKQKILKTLALGLLLVSGVNGAWGVDAWDNTSPIYNPETGTSSANLKAAMSEIIAGTSESPKTYTLYIYKDVTLGTDENSSISVPDYVTLNIEPQANVKLTRGGHKRGNRWFLVKQNHQTLNIGNDGYSLTIEDDGSTTICNTILRREAGTMTVKNVTFNKIKFGDGDTSKSEYGYIYSTKNNTAAGYCSFTNVTVSNCSTTTSYASAFLSSQATYNDALYLQGAVNFDNCTGTDIYAAARIRLGEKDGTSSTTITASNPISIYWANATKNIATSVVVKAKATMLSNFILTNTDLGLFGNDTDLKLTQAYTLDVTDAKASTLILPFESTIPADVTVYTLKYTSDASAVTAKEVTGGKLAANTPVLINAEEGAYKFVSTATSGDLATGSGTYTDGALTGVYAETVPGEGHYILTNHSGSVGFRKTVATSKVKAYRAYLTASGGGSREFLDIDFSEDNVTAIKNVKVGSEDHVYYDLQGRRVLYPKKGLYIVNGKKVIIK